MAGSKETKKRYQDLGCYFRFTETCLDIYKYKMVYFSAIANCCSYTLAGIGLVAYGFRTGFEKFCLDYGLLVIMMVVYNCHITICLIYHKKWKAMRQQFVAGFSWNLDNFAPSYRMEILRISSGNEESTKLVGLATALITISIQVDFYSSIKEIILYFGIPEHFIPIILVGIYTHIVYMSLSSVMATYYIFYFLWLIRIQQVVLRSMADKFRSNILLNRSDNFVEDALKSIIKSHQTIIRCFRLVKNESHVLRLGTSISMFLCLGFFVFLVTSPFHTSMQGQVGFISVHIFIFYLSHEGQNVDDENEQFHMLLYEFNWYAWNTKNCKIFAIFFMNTAEMAKEQGSALFQVNHEYFMKTARMAYALLNLLRTTTN
ncbi:uncharacterized protein LOC125503636 isoform X1 [Dendroctonus ponderosae]|uniref:uncharacterized protein LOC125503636 isoform X1 n=1 Tax=Dendroctonus ponderosae TaxID=77166 RepID=UPI002035505E|nr:uncharacterized protein LOC125503636 isoform X1 [Dendroctonus ponderosae]